MTRILALALVLLPALPALAGGRTLALSTVVTNGRTQLRPGEQQISVRAPKSVKLSRALGDSDGSYVPVPGRLNSAGDKRLFSLGAGGYYASPSGLAFSIKN